MKYIAMVFLSLMVSSCIVAPYDPYYSAYPAYGGYYYAPAPTYVSVGYGESYYHRGYYGRHNWR